MAQSSSYAKNPRLMRFAKFEVNEGKHDSKLCEDTTHALEAIFEDPYVKEKLLVAMQKQALVLSEKIFKLNQGQDVAGNIVGQNVVSPLLKPP